MIDGPSLVLLVFASLGAGVALGAWIARSSPRAPDDTSLAGGDDTSEGPAPEPAGGAARPWVREAFRDQAYAIADEALGEDDSRRDVIADAVTALVADGWVLGVTELRAGMASHSGLPPELVDQAAAAALAELEGRGPP